MTPIDIESIESELGISLPPHYKKVVAHYPIPAYAGNVETMFWDDARKLIELNMELRKGRRFVDPWPVRFFALGTDAGGCSDALDLDDPEHGIFWFDRQHVTAGPADRSPEKIETWVARQIKELTADLMDAGSDPDGAPRQRKAQEERNYRHSAFGCVVLIVAVTAVLLLGIWIGTGK
jgi:hypothetical protein